MVLLFNPPPFWKIKALPADGGTYALLVKILFRARSLFSRALYFGGRRCFHFSVPKGISPRGTLPCQQLKKRHIVPVMYKMPMKALKKGNKDINKCEIDEVLP